MKLKQTRIVGVESSANHVDVSLQLAGTEETSKPVKLNITFDNGLNDSVRANCQFNGLTNDYVVATRRELGTDGLAILYISKV